MPSVRSLVRREPARPPLCGQPATLWKATGQHVFAFAPSSQASRNVLAKEGFKDAETLEMLLKNEKLQARTKGQVLWVDEAGLVSAWICAG